MRIFLISVTTNDCKHLIVDAGHISIESHLVPKEAIMTVHQKRNAKYTDEDFKNLESLMYDKLSLRLKDAQVYFAFSCLTCLLISYLVHHWGQSTSLSNSTRCQRQWRSPCFGEDKFRSTD